MAKNLNRSVIVTDKVDNRYESYKNIANRRKSLFTSSGNPFRSY